LRPVVKPQIAFAQVGDEGVVYDSLSGSIHMLNPSASLLYRVCDGSATIDELASDVADAFEVPVDEVRPQVVSLVESLAMLGVVEDAEHAAHHNSDLMAAPDLRAAVRREVPRST
jgi:PqqD family protein of HPr-rel-A system